VTEGHAKWLTNEAMKGCMSNGFVADLLRIRMDLLRKIALNVYLLVCISYVVVFCGFVWIA
jgi:hypothetical protein